MTSYFFPTSTCHLKKGLGQKAIVYGTKKVTNGLNDICRNVFLDIQKLDVDVRCKSIQIGIVATIREANPTFRCLVPEASQKHSSPKAVLKLETRSSINLTMKTGHIERTLGNLGQKGHVYTNERRIDDRLGRPDSFEPAFFSLFDMSELLRTIWIRFKVSLKVKVTSATSEAI
jgi:hypothetical protein